jgi:hypothetical protein
MNRYSRVVVAFLLLTALVQAGVASEAENVALAGIESVNRNQGARFVGVAHSKLLQKIRDLIAAQVEADMKQGLPPSDLKDYGVLTVNEVNGLPVEVVARITVDHMCDSEPAVLREMMHTAKFSVTGSRPAGPGVMLVTVSFELVSGSRHQPQTVEILSKLDGRVWKYWGPPEPGAK